MAHDCRRCAARAVCAPRFGQRGGILPVGRWVWGAAAVLACGTLAPPVALADAPQWYIGAGVGAAQLAPEPIAGFGADDTVEPAYKVTVGRELSDQWSMEAFLGSLGSADLQPAGSADYTVYGATVQYGLPDNNDGLSVFVKGGVIGMNVDSSVPLDTEESLQPYAGVGVEYEFRNGVAVRGEYEHYAKDAQLVSLSLIKKLGGRTAPEATTLPAARAEQAQVQATLLDSDRDGVPDVRDRCLNTPAGASVNAYGCPVFLGTLEGVEFDAKGALTPASTVILDRVAREMRYYPGVTYFVVGHTDNQGNAVTNRTRSTEWAKAVAQYLASRGVDARNLRYGGYGGARPRASNDTPEGRAKNRRIEIVPASRPVDPTGTN